MSRSNGLTSEVMTKFLYEEGLSDSEKVELGLSRASPLQLSSDPIDGIDIAAYVGHQAIVSNSYTGLTTIWEAATIDPSTWLQTSNNTSAVGGTVNTYYTTPYAIEQAMYGGLNVGDYAVIRYEGGRTMQWLGDVTAGELIDTMDDTSGCTDIYGTPFYKLKGGYGMSSVAWESSTQLIVLISSYNTEYDGGQYDDRYAIINKSDNSIFNAVNIYNSYAPWHSTVMWSEGTSFARVPCLCIDNWLIIKETYELIVQTTDSGAHTKRVNGISMYNYSSNYIGWVSADAIPLMSEAGSYGYSGSSSSVPVSMATYTHNLSEAANYTEYFSFPYITWSAFFSKFKTPASRQLVVHI